MNREDIKAITSKQYWDNSWESHYETKFKPYNVNDTEYSQLFKKYLPKDQSLKCVEIGGYPGRHLIHFAKKFKYHPTAIEYSDHCDHIDMMMKHNQIDDYKIINQDFFTVENMKFDVVSSFGFIEHFVNFDEVIKRHFDIAEDNGYVIIGVPCFMNGFQGTLRRLVYSDRELKHIWCSHNPDAMNLETIKGIAKEYSSEILFADYLKGFRIGWSHKGEHIRPNMGWFAFLAKAFSKVFGHALPASRLFSLEFMIIARK